MDIVSVIGARPQFVKAAVVSRALRQNGIKEVILHSGQHYDAAMSRVFFEQLEIPAPEINFEAGSGMHGEQTAVILTKTEQYLASLPQKPAFLLVYGDTNSTLAAALAASKLHIKIIHVEAGLRSFNREMPEEINRVLTDHLSSLLFCSSDTGEKQLAKEGITEGVHVTGDVMYDAVRLFSSQVKSSSSSSDFDDENYWLFTLHRPANTDNEARISQILDALKQSGKNILWPVHPRIKNKMAELNLPDRIRCIQPLPYLEMLGKLSSCSGVLTDSGGLQKEAYWCKKQCITLREETEWTETLSGGWNTLVGADKNNILGALSKKPSTEWVPIYGDGFSSQHIADIILKQLGR
ncbi:MAG: UDP-N-acetylglucosamine 2-epimerase (non-hydrolyzing) [Balneolales bacterium]|nr:UDP-N-acetylglucosamine 2-epimerase (non-hydrolyzing) [Balneolales bacterium]